NNKKAHVEKALNTVYQTDDDLYAHYVLAFGKPAGNVSGSTTSWTPVINKNIGANFSVDRNDSGEFRYKYHGVDGDDIISTKYSIGGTAISMLNRNDMHIITGEGDDIVSVGQDIGAWYGPVGADIKYFTDMGDGDDILFVGLSNESIQINLRADGSLRAIGKDDYLSSGEIINVSGNYDSSDGGVISSTTISMGSGDDTILALGHSGGGNAVQNSVISLGSGNDIIQVNGSIERSHIDGGAGFDTLVISNGTIYSGSFSGFEMVELTSSGHLVLDSKDFAYDDVNRILKVTGDYGSSVDIQNFDFREGGVGHINENNTGYTTYISSDHPDMSLWIQDGVEIK
ncbi:TPA: hypothetical protein RLU78_003617, partial [Escherichia coli]|nr:hypothetical protein [Escherichia coli]HDW2612664.1 hypothetical protein [Escherichia coli]